MELIINLIENKKAEMIKKKIISEKSIHELMDSFEQLYHECSIKVCNDFLKQAEKAIKLLNENK